MCTAGQKVQIKAQLSSSSCLHKVEHVAAADVRKLKYFMLKRTFSVGVHSDGAEYAYNSMRLETGFCLSLIYANTRIGYLKDLKKIKYI